VGKASLLHQHSSSKPTAHSGFTSATSINRSLAKLAFFLSYRGSGEVIQRLARCQRTPRSRTTVARMVSPERGFSTRPSSKATCAAISSVHRLVSLPNSLGERWSNSLKVSALCSSKAARVLLGRDEPGVRACRPRWLKSHGWRRARFAARSPGSQQFGGPHPPSGGGHKHLGTAQGESVFGAQPGFKPFAFIGGELTYKDRRLHAYYCNS
jgi:hypothetical protein